MKSKDKKYTEAAERSVENSASYALRELNSLLDSVGVDIDTLNDLSYGRLAVNRVGDIAIRVSIYRKIEILVQNILYDNLLKAIVNCKANDYKKYAESYMGIISKKLPKWLVYDFKTQVLFSEYDLTAYLALRGTEEEKGNGFRIPNFVYNKANRDVLLCALMRDIEIDKQSHEQEKVGVLRTTLRA